MTWIRRALAIVLVVLAAAATAASARTVQGSARAERLFGTARADLILARGGADRVSARSGDDRIAVQYDGARDTVSCGPGRDVVTADARDRVLADCETVTRLISRDPYRNPESQHETQVEPDAAAWANTIVAVFQTGRRFEGGASDIGFAVSRDAGVTWRSGFLPGVGVFSRPAGSAARVSDPVVAYDSVRRVWLANTLGVSPDNTTLLVSRSTDGFAWGLPITVARAVGAELSYDKNWIACDNGERSRFRGRCYVVYTDHRLRRPRIASQFSDDGGLTWSPPVIALDRGSVAVGVLPVVRPNGDLVVPFFGPSEIASVTSRDGGASFSAPVRIAAAQARDVEDIRPRFPLPAADVDAAGMVYVTWHDCAFQPGCRANDVLLAKSADGLTWSAPVRVPTAAATAPRTHFLPSVAVDPASSGSRARLGLVYYWAASNTCAGLACRIDTGYIASSDGGATWSAPRPLSAQPMSQLWIPRTTLGRMLADYIAVVWARGRFVPVFSLASEPRGETLQVAAAATLIRR